MRSANVFFKDLLAGFLEETDRGSYLFTYASSYLADPKSLPISLTMPLKKESYESKLLFPFFDGLIPEGWLLDLAIKNWKLNPRDRMGLLLETCHDCIGAVRIEKNA